MKLSGFRLLIAAMLVSCLSAVSAQSARFTVAAAASGPSVTVALLDQRTAGGRASLGVQFLPRPGLALHLRHTTGLGPLGNVIIDADVAGVQGGPAAASLSGRAAVGPVALRLRTYVRSGDGVPSLRAADQAFPQQPASDGQLLWGVQLGADWRVSRDLLLTADPGLIFGARGQALLLPVQVQLRGFAGPHDLRLRIESLLPFSSAAQELSAFSAAGAGLRISRQRAASWELWLLYGGNSTFTAPGIRFTAQEQLAGGTLQAGLRLEPYRSDLAPLGVGLGYSRKLGTAELQLRFDLAAPELVLVFEAGVNVPFD